MEKLKQKVLSYYAVFDSAEEGGYTVTIPSLPGCISEGDTFEEALKNIQEATELYVEVMLERKECPEQKINQRPIIAPVTVTA